MKKILTKTSGFLLGIFCVGGLVYATATIWNISSPNIKDKTERSIVTSDDFNSIVNTLKNIYNDGTYIGINQTNPEYTLDVNGDVIVSNILSQDENYAALGCSTLGTDSTGKLECHSSYSLVYSGWTTCTKTCGTGSHTRTAKCKRDDGEIVDDSFCPSPTLSGHCNTHSCCNGKIDSSGNCCRKSSAYCYWRTAGGLNVPGGRYHGAEWCGHDETNTTHCKDETIYWSGARTNITCKCK